MVGREAIGDTQLVRHRLFSPPGLVRSGLGLAWHRRFSRGIKFFIRRGRGRDAEGGLATALHHQETGVLVLCPVPALCAHALSCVYKAAKGVKLMHCIAIIVY